MKIFQMLISSVQKQGCEDNWDVIPTIGDYGLPGDLWVILSFGVVLTTEGRLTTI